MKSFSVVFSLLLLAACSSRSKPESKAPQESKSGPKWLEMTTPAQQHVGLRTVRAGFEDLQVVGTVQPINTRIGHVRPLARGACRESMCAWAIGSARVRPSLPSTTSILLANSLNRSTSRIGQ